MKAYPILLSLLITLFAGSAGMPGTFEPDKLRVHLRMDKRVFYSDEEVSLHVCVKNVSDLKNYFEVYDASGGEESEYTTFQPLVFDLQGRDAEITVPYKVGNRGIEDLLRVLDKRIVELAPGEMFVHTVNLKRIYRINLGASYRVKCHFYPAFDGNGAVKSDNELTFKIIEEKRYNKPSEVDALNRSLAPKEVMLLTLRAEKDKDWENWIKYINIEKYIRAFPEFIQRYGRANFEEKSRIEKEFIAFCTRERDDYVIDYKILGERVEKSGKYAYVDAVVDRYGSRQTYRYKYRFTMEQYKNMWLITDETATVMKGAKK